MVSGEVDFYRMHSVLLQSFVNMDVHKTMKGSTRNQYLAAISVNIITMSFGSFCGWTSASFLTLQSDESPLETGPMTNSEVGLVASMWSIGGLLGTIFFAWLSDVIGRKRCLQLIAIPALIGWLIIPLATKPIHLCISRFFGGFSGGAIFSLAPVYITEISHDQIRGKLGSLMVLFCNFGVLSVFIMGCLYRYDIVALIFASLSILFLCSFSFMPDSPPFLFRKNLTKEALKSLCFFQNIPFSSVKYSEKLKSEFEKLKGKEEHMNSCVETNWSWENFNNRTARKAILLGIGVATLYEFCGCSAMINYSGNIFQISGSNFSPNQSSIFIGIINVIGCYSSTLLVERAGRKFLLIISAIGTGLGQVVLATYINLTSIGYDLEALNWIPVASFSFVIFAASCGLLTLHFLVISEIMPPPIRSKGCMLCIAAMWIQSFFILKGLPVATQIFGMDRVLFAFGGFCFFGALFVNFLIPETRGKSFEEIMQLL